MRWKYGAEKQNSHIPELCAPWQAIIMRPLLFSGRSRRAYIFSPFDAVSVSFSNGIFPNSSSAFLWSFAKSSSTSPFAAGSFIGLYHITWLNRKPHIAHNGYREHNKQNYYHGVHNSAPFRYSVVSDKLHYTEIKPKKQYNFNIKIKYICIIIWNFYKKLQTAGKKHIFRKNSVKRSLNIK